MANQRGSKMHLKRLPLLFMVVENQILYLTFRRQKIYKVKSIGKFAKGWDPPERTWKM